MNIWIINHNAVPPSLGSQSRHYYFSKYLLPKGHNIKIFTSGTIHNSDVELVPPSRLFIEKHIDGVPYVFIRTHEYKGNGLDRIYNLLDFPLKMQAVCRNYSAPDIIYTSSPNILGAFAAVLLARRKKVPCVLEIRDLWPESIVEYLHWSPYNPVIQALYRVEKWMYKKSNALIFTFEGGKEYICDKHWDNVINLDKIYHLNNGVDLNEFNFNRDHYQLNDSDLNDPEYFNIIYTGAIRKANDVRKIIECAEELKNVKKIRFLIYGTGNELESLKSYCISSGLTNVVFKGYIENKYIPYVLSKSRLNLLNYQPTNMFRYGGSQNKLFEYLASGIPIISNVNQNYSLIERFQCGTSKEFHSGCEYAQAILDIYNLPKTSYDIMCKNARDAAMLYDYQKLGGQLEEILLKYKEKTDESNSS